MGRKKKDGKFVNCYISSNLVETLEAVSEDTGKSKTRIIEDALTEHFESRGIGAFDSKQEPSKDLEFEKEKSAFFITAEGKVPCVVREEIAVYGEPYYLIEFSDGQTKKVHRSTVEI